MKKQHIAAMMILCTMATACSNEKAPQKPEKNVVPAIELSNMDTSINPADDFFLQ